MTARKIKTVFLDRDGVINRERGHITCVEDLEILSSALAGLRRLKEANVHAIIVTNQSGIARGILSLEDLAKIHARMTSQVKEAGGQITAVYYCPFHPRPGPNGIQQYTHETNLRKPGVGMFEKARDDLGIDIRESVMVGDSEKDYFAAQTLNIPFFGVRSAKERELRGRCMTLYDGLSDVVEEILASS